MGKGSPQAPAPVNPQVAANAQTGTNVSTAIANKSLNDVNTVTPYGSTTYGQDGGYTDPTTGQWVPQVTQTSTLNPLAESILTGTENTANSLLPAGQTLANQASSSLTTPLNPNGASENILQAGPQALDTNVANAYYNQQKSYLDPVWQQNNTNLQDQLSRQGIPVGSDAYNSATKNLASSQNQAYGNAANSSITQGATGANSLFNMALLGQNQNLQQQQTLQSNPLQLLSSLYGGAPA